MSELWTPLGAAGYTSKQKVVRPFAQLQKRIQKLGFEAGLQIDRTERVITIQFMPQNDRTRQAVKVAAQSSRANALRVSQAYGPGDSPFEVALTCLEKGIDEIEGAL